MSFQLIYTSASHLLEPGQTGYGVVARSEAMPQLLIKNMVKLSLFKEDEKLISGPQYSYHILDCAGATYHVLSSVQSAGADYTGRECHIAHHLALHREEVDSLRSSKSRPTPASIILALKNDGFWMSSWEQSPHLITQEPRLSTDQLPDIERQARWKKLTKHKSNARALITPPYEHDCLIMMEEGASSEDVLVLLAESDWLSATRGWGCTFTSCGWARDTFAKTQRIAIVEGSPMEGKARRTGRPILKVDDQLILPEYGQGAGTNSSIIPDRSPTGISFAAPVLARRQTLIDPAPVSNPIISHIPYQYREPTDEEVFIIKPKTSTLYRVVSILLLVSLVGIGGVAVGYIISDNEQASAPITDQDSHNLPPRYLSPMEENLKGINDFYNSFNKVINSPYNWLEAEKVLNQLTFLAQSVTKKDDSLIFPHIQHLHHVFASMRYGNRTGQSHLSAIESLSKLAEEAGMNKQNLLLFYFLHSTNEHSPKSWSRYMAKADAQKLLHRLQSSDLSYIYSNEKLHAFFQQIEERNNNIGIASNKLNANVISIVEGEKLPPIITNLLEHSPIVLDQGHVTISYSVARPIARELSPLKNTVQITPAEGGYKLQLSDGSDVIANLFFHCDENQVFRGITHDGRPTVCSIRLSHLPEASEFIYSPNFDSYIPLFPQPPHGQGETDEMSTITPANILIKGSGLLRALPEMELKLSPELRARWENESTHSSRSAQSTINIPLIVGYRNRLHIDTTNLYRRHSPSFVRYQAEVLQHESFVVGLGVYEIQVKRFIDIESTMTEQFSIIANRGVTPVGRFLNHDFSLANLYHITNKISRSKQLSEVERSIKEFFHLYSNDTMRQLMNKIFYNIPELQNVTAEEARSNSPQAIERRRKLAVYICNAESRKHMQNSICRYISAQLADHYDMIQEKARNSSIKGIRIKLQKIKKEGENELIWEFEPTPIRSAL